MDGVKSYFSSDFFSEFDLKASTLPEPRIEDFKQYNEKIYPVYWKYAWMH